MADWLEVAALVSADKNSSMQDLVSALRTFGDAGLDGEQPEIPDEPLDLFERLWIDDEDPVEGDDETGVEDEQSSYAEISDSGSEALERCAESAFGEIESRARACRDEGYPFTIHDQYIQVLEETGALWSYTFLLLLSRLGKDAAGSSELKATSLFEEVAAQAAEGYLGGVEAGARHYLLGYPRLKTKKGFVDAVDDLCKELGEGGKCQRPPKGMKVKDGKLDVVVWKPFPDGRKVQMIGLGQCATGIHWESKTTELNVGAWWGNFMTEAACLEPFRMFFVPHRIPEDTWTYRGREAGLFFDRCRLAAFSWNLHPETVAACKAWATKVMEVM